ncbi:MAG: hypothetical protein Q9198_006781 [Flavoplaca austrocitrina]
MKSHGKQILQRVKAGAIRALGHAPHLLLQLCTLPYYHALRRNTLDAVQAIEDSGDLGQRRSLTRRFILFKINESRYVQIAVSVFLKPQEVAKDTATEREDMKGVLSFSPLYLLASLGTTSPQAIGLRLVFFTAASCLHSWQL